MNRKKNPSDRRTRQDYPAMAIGETRLYHGSTSFLYTRQAPTPSRSKYEPHVGKKQGMKSIDKIASLMYKL